MHEYAPFLLMLASIFAGIWLNRRELTEFKADMNRQFDLVNKRLDRSESENQKRFDRIDADLREFYGNDKVLEGRVNELSTRIK